MGRKRKRSLQGGDASGREGTRAPAPPGKRTGAASPALRFVLVAGAFMGVFYALFYTSPEDSPGLDAFIRGYLSVYASVAGWILGLFGLEVQVHQASMWIDGSLTEVARGCDAMEPIALYVAAVLALQVPWRARLLGLAAGVPILMLLNLVRIIALVAVHLKLPGFFETAHLTVGQVVFIVCTIALWLGWASLATRPPRPTEESRAPAAD